MGTRRLARENALKALFELDLSGNSLSVILERIIFEENLTGDGADFFQSLLRHYSKNKSQIDAAIEKQSDHWKMSRMATVDRNILRLGVCEILYVTDVPKSVSINEYLEIAKKFGSEDSSGFINGILDHFEPAKPVS